MSDPGERSRAAAMRARMARPRAPLDTVRGLVTCADLGRGPAVLALHGGMGGWDQGVLLAQAAFAEPDRFRVLAPSRPGYPGTALALGATPVAQADLYAALLDRLGIADALVIAVSAGGPSALQLALRHPLRVRGLILVSAASGRLDLPPAAAARLPVLRRMARHPWLGGLVRAGAMLRPGRSARRSIPDPDLRSRTLRHPEAGPMLKALQASALSRLGQRLPGTLNDIDVLGALTPLPLDRIRTRVLAIHGRTDSTVPFAHAERVAREVPGAALVAVAGGHVSLFTHLDAVRSAIASVLAEG